MWPLISMIAFGAFGLGVGWLLGYHGGYAAGFARGRSEKSQPEN
jgi:hypothetical protein